MANMKLRKGDVVMVISGRDKGKTGKITEVNPKANQVTVDGINTVKKHRKPTQAQPQGGIIELTKPLNASKVGIVDPQDKKKTTRVGYDFNKNGEKIRVYKSNGKEIK